MSEELNSNSESSAHAQKIKPLLFASNLQFWFETVRAFGASSYGGSEFGEVLATASRIKSGDFDSWFEEWNATGEKVAIEAEKQLMAGHRTSAREGFLRASTYYRLSEFFLHGNRSDQRIKSAYKKSVAAYVASAALFDPPIEPVEIPYEGTTLPGYFHRVDNSGRKRPLIILHSGFDGSAEEMHVDGARAAVDRGYNVLTFDGPGQFGPLHRENLKFRSDWEKVVTPVVDFALARPEVDPKKIALMGASLGGYLAPRAAAFEKRISALIANDGVYDYGAANLGPIPPEQRAAARSAMMAKHAPAVDRSLAEAMQKSPTVAWAMTHGMFAMGASTPREYIAAALGFHLRDGIAEAITCPTLVCEAEGDMFFKGQPQELYDHLKCSKTLMPFTEREGAGAHCQVGAARLAFARIFDWLDETFAAAKTG